MTPDEANAALLALWGETFPVDADVYAPIAYGPLKQGALMFVGVNPSFSAKGWTRLLKQWDGDALEPAQFFAWKNRGAYNVADSVSLEALAREHYPFYKLHKSLSQRCKLPWEHLDVFAFRETEQSRLDGSLRTGPDGLSLTSFGLAQYRIFESLLSSARPRAIVVANALASRIYQALRAPVADPVAGCHWDGFGGVRVPVFFSGMLTGARCLDVFSRERLFWHIERTVQSA